MLEDNSIIILIIIILHAIGVAIYKFYKPRITGAKGEYAIRKVLKRLNKKQYETFNDIYLELDNRSTQIDHLIISNFGIFVIETKNYQGWIHGNENSEYWTQTIYKKKTKFRNPIKQNWSHILFLKKILKDFENINYVPIIVFAGKATLKNVYSKVPIVYKHELLAEIKNNRTPKLSNEEIDDIKNQISNFITDAKNSKKKHKKYVKQNIQNRKKKINSLNCPNCSGILKSKNGRYGKFYGCSNFPECKYSRNA